MSTEKEIKTFLDKIRKFARTFKDFNSFHDAVHRNFNPKGIIRKGEFEAFIQKLAAELNMK